MPSAKTLAAVAAGACLAALQAHAAAGPVRSAAVLASPVAQPASIKIGDTSWRCDGVACLGERLYPTLDNPVRDCRKVAAAFGAVAAFRSEGLKLEGGDLKACNVAAKSGGEAITGK